MGLEIKREFIDGQLSSWPRRSLPVLAATGGMIAPAVTYVGLNAGTAATLRGWAIPTATDIAFALRVLALLGRRVPVSLKIFLTALAIIDDLGAVAIIAAFYTADLSFAWLSAGAATLAALAALNRAGVERLPVYLALGLVLWLFVLKSGGHATLAGVALAMTIPLRQPPGRPDDLTSPLHVLEHALQPWVAFGIVPIFGFANAGVSLAGIDMAARPLTLFGIFPGAEPRYFRGGVDVRTRDDGESWSYACTGRHGNRIGASSLTAGPSGRFPKDAWGSAFRRCAPLLLRRG